MQLEDYFDFLAPDDIRLKGSRIGIEFVLDEFLQGKTADEIAIRFPTLSLEQIYATILYYHHEHSKVRSYYANYVAYCEQSQKDHDADPDSRNLKQKLYAGMAERTRQTA
jgi:uncharacterized protein (DUF433 family)